MMGMDFCVVKSVSRLRNDILRVMSYDILAFDPSSTKDSDFPGWWADQSSWSEDHSYNDIAVTTPALREFYADLIKTFPPMNGPDSPTNDEIDKDSSLEGRLTDYAIGTSLIYGAFAWSQESEARQLFTSLAAKHRVAVALVSDGDEILRPPAASDRLTRAKPARKRLWGRK